MSLVIAALTRRAFTFAGVLLAVSVVLFSVLADGSRPASANPLTGVSDVAVGALHSCALTTAGSVKCWGSNGSGQLGDGTTAGSSVPVDVVGLTSGVEAIVIGVAHTCALTTSGGVKCWGHNAQGQLGDGTTVNSPTPVDVVGLTSGAVAISAGEHHSCAVTSSGSVKCWGDNLRGQLGDGTFVDALTPVTVAGISAAVAVELGLAHGCALTATGGLVCWGDNSFGQLGDGTTASAGIPVGVSGMAVGAVAVAAGSSHSCVLTTTGGVKCWGDNVFGQLGDGTTIGHFTPADVSGLTAGVSAVAAGSLSSCAIDAAGAVQCWGTSYSATPVVIEGLESGTTGVAMKVSHACTVTSSGGVKCWGSNGLGQLGDGTEISRLTPVDVVELTVKPTPTSTPCPGGICPTPTPVPACPAEACLALAVIDAAGNTACHSDENVKCEIAVGSSFTLAVDALAVPATGYIGMQTYIDFGSDLIYEFASASAENEIVWPDCALAVKGQPVAKLDDQGTPVHAPNPPFNPLVNDSSEVVAHQCASGLLPPQPISIYTGNLVELSFTCSNAATTTEVILRPLGDPLTPTVTGSAFTFLGPAPSFIQTITTPKVSNLTINCIQPPPPVGGIAPDSDLQPLPLEGPGASSGSYGVATLSITIAAIVALLGGIVWYATRRRRRAT